MSEKFIRVTSGPSELELIKIDDPSVGQNFSTIITEGYTYLLLGFSATLTTSVVANNRHMILRVHLGAIPLFAAPATGLHVASEALLYSFYANAYNVDLSPTSFDMVAKLPSNLFLPGGVRIHSDVYQIDVGDQISDISLYLQKWPVLVA